MGLIFFIPEKGKSLYEHITNVLNHNVYNVHTINEANTCTYQYMYIVYI